MFWNFLWVGLGGSIGAILRYAVALASNQFLGVGFPWGTFFVNALGCLILGLLIGSGVQKNAETAWLMIAIGILGSFTTFSTFSVETVLLAVDGHGLSAILNVTGNVVTCLAACWAGMIVAGWLTAS